MGMSMAPARKAHRKAQADHKRPRLLVVAEVVRVAVDLAAAVLDRAVVGVGAEVVVVTDDLNPPCKHTGLHRQYAVEAGVLL